MRFVYCLLPVVLFYSCSVSNSEKEQERGSNKVKLASAIRSQVAQKLMLERGLIPCGFGGGAIEQIEFLALSFYFRQPLSIGEGRDLVVIAVHELLDAVNSNTEIRPYLDSYPFSAKNIEIVIFVQDVKGHLLSTSAADIFGCYEGVCRYKTVNTQCNALHILLEETFMEAERIAQENAFQMRRAQ